MEEWLGKYKILVVYYSLEGNTRCIAEAIAQAVKADILELKPKQDIPSTGFMRYVKGGKQVMMNEKPPLKPFTTRPEEYDILIVGTPVWAFTYAPAIGTFFLKAPLENKKIALFCCYGGSEGKTFVNLEKLLHGNTVVDQIGFKDPLKQGKEEAIRDAQDWAKKLVEAIYNKEN